MYKEFRIDDDVVTLSSMMNFQQSNKRRREDDDFDIIAHRFGKEDVTLDELERYLNSSKVTLSTQEANMSFDISLGEGERDDVSARDKHGI